MRRYLLRPLAWHECPPYCCNPRAVYCRLHSSRSGRALHLLITHVSAERKGQKEEPGRRSALAEARSGFFIIALRSDVGGRAFLLVRLLGSLRRFLCLQLSGH